MESDKEEGLANKPQADEGGIGPDQQSEQPDDTGGGVGQGTADESFKIWVRISRKKQFEVTRSSTVGNVKAMIQDLINLPVRKQILMHGDKELLKSAPDLASDDSLNTEAFWNDLWTPLKLEVNKSHDIASLKSQIEDMSRAKADRLELTFKGENLDDDERTLEDYEVENDSTIQASVRADPAQAYSGKGKVA